MVGVPETLTMVCVSAKVPRFTPVPPTASCQRVTVPVGEPNGGAPSENVTCADSVSATPVATLVNCGVTVVVVVAWLTVADWGAEVLGALAESPVYPATSPVYEPAWKLLLGVRVAVPLTTGAAPISTPVEVRK